jgi:ubiquinone/menaquinone biosynthesis C-methylase UbiE
VEITGVHEKATAFEGAATVYEQARPGYPAQAVTWLIDALELGPGRRVVDLAAGTGKLTRDLVRSGAGVIAVEPVAGMRRTLAATAAPPGNGRPPVSVVAAVAQAMPLGGATVNAVTVAQAFHWFATREALAEIHRVLGPGGGLGLIWNHRDQSDPLQAALTELMEPQRAGTPSYESGAWRRALEPGELFDVAGEFHVAWHQPTDVEGVADRVASVSFIAAMAPTDRDRLLDRVRAEARALDQPLAFSYEADVFTFARRD